MNKAGVTIQSLLTRYQNNLWESDKQRESGVKFVEEIASINTQAFEKITTADYDCVVQALRNRGNADSTINRKMYALTKLLRAAQADNFIPNVPLFRRLEEQSDGLRYLSVDEEKSLTAFIRQQDDYYAVFTTFLIDTGMKLGEAIMLRWENIAGQGIHIPSGRSSLARTIPATLRVQQILDELKMEPRGPFFRVHPHSYRLIWNTVKKGLGLEADAAIVPTVLRHTCASRLISSGIDLKLVQVWLGNRDYKSMLRYEKLLNLSNFDSCKNVLEKFA